MSQLLRNNGQWRHQPRIMPAMNQANQRLQQLCIVRAIVIAAQLLGLVVAWYAGLYDLSFLPLAVILAVMSMINLISWWRCRQHWWLSDQEFLGHLLIDVLSFAALLYFSGGANNPFISYLLVPICIAAATLPARYTALLATLAITCYSLLLEYHISLSVLAPGSEHADHAGMHHSSPHHGDTHHTDNGGPSLHIIGMWLNFVVSAVLITVFLGRMATLLREQQRALQESREQSLRDEQLLSLAALSAGTAHELGTPLATMRVLIDEMREDLILSENSQQQQAEDLQLLSQQVALCANKLQQLGKQAEQGGLRQNHDISDFLQQLQDQWQLLRPATTLDIQQAVRNKTYAWDDSLRQSLMNLMDNAADAAPERIVLAVEEDRQDLCFTVVDYGPGISQELSGKIGQPFISTKPEGGLGLGLFLSHSTATRYGGRLDYFPASKTAQGNRMRLRLKLDKIRAADSAQSDA